jgi:hypothetical protein
VIREAAVTILKENLTRHPSDRATLQLQPRCRQFRGRTPEEGTRCAE